MADKKSHLFLITFGPVQSFISNARKTKDLYASSRMLSVLTKAGMQAINDQELFKKNPQDIKIIFPADIHSNSLPNRILAKFSLEESKRTELAKAISEAIKNKLKTLATEALKKAKQSIENPPKGFWEQIAQHLSIHWVFEPVSSDYTQTYHNLEAQLASIKNTAMFEQYRYHEDYLGEQGKKCSLDGENNALFFGTPDSESKQKSIKKWNGGAFFLNDDEVKVYPTEGLSAISLTKRFYQEQGFPSTAKIALMQDMTKAEENTALADKIDVFRKFFRKKDFDEQLFYEENLNATYLEKHGIEVSNAKLSNIQEAYHGISSHLKTKYYALTIFDGDSMGKWLRGTKLKKDTDLAVFHTKFSEILSDFAKQAQGILSEVKHNGKTVYAGGDDFLGFINLHHLFEVMSELRTEFNKQVNSQLQKYAEQGENLTFSAGIMIAHYKTPLSEVLKKAREVEQTAKKLGDRNAFAIAVMKHSGELQECVFKWDTDASAPSASGNWQAVETIFSMLKDELFSNKFITNLSTELYQLAGLELKKLYTVPKEAIFTEMKRLLKRALIDKTQADKIHTLYAALVTLFESAEFLEEAEEKRVKNPGNRKMKSIENFIHALHIADFIHRKI